MEYRTGVKLSLVLFSRGQPRPALTKLEKERREEEKFNSRLSKAEEAIKENKKRKIIK
jgi:hypothetical protein